MTDDADIKFIYGYIGWQKNKDIDLVWGFCVHDTEANMFIKDKRPLVSRNYYLNSQTNATSFVFCYDYDKDPVIVKTTVQSAIEKAIIIDGGHLGKYIPVNEHHLTVLRPTIEDFLRLEMMQEMLSVI
jgi:hypothetical protein